MKKETKAVLSKFKKKIRTELIFLSSMVISLVVILILNISYDTNQYVNFQKPLVVHECYEDGFIFASFEPSVFDKYCGNCGYKFKDGITDGIVEKDNYCYKCKENCYGDFCRRCGTEIPEDGQRWKLSETNFHSLQNYVTIIFVYKIFLIVCVYSTIFSISYGLILSLSIYDELRKGDIKKWDSLNI